VLVGRLDNSSITERKANRIVTFISSQILSSGISQTD
jgi:hypothetical protein